MLSVSLRMYVYFSILLMFGTKRNLPPFFIFFPNFCFNMKKEEREVIGGKLKFMSLKVMNLNLPNYG